MKQYFLAILILIGLYSCLTGGTHGSIKEYEYSVSKKVLQKAVGKVILGNPDIHVDTTKNYIIDITNGKNDTIIDNHYNDSIEYLTIKIDNNEGRGGSNEYTFQYSKGEGADTSNTSFLSIAYAFDENSNGGSNGNGGVSSNTPLLKKKLINLVESKFIYRIDRELGKKHTDAN
jgi:hypothetical protein